MADLLTVLEIYGNVFYGGKARDSTVEVLSSCYDEMICIEMELCTIGNPPFGNN